MVVDKQSELMSDLLFTVHHHGGDDVSWKPPIQSLIFEEGVKYDDYDVFEEKLIQFTSVCIS